ncbi:hypothetical protein F1C58_11735 [Glaciihabitans sp. INWT7]|uniref:hypothetical protein n=1 Tax=Glaciihabitans sp. INWT7 TaxID=2596912 RepID=UPI0016285B96|nr:hypothetical protein [Glaciihabitans sp. INWT7]QNE47504.1 hypothetical protein F1C58_11735 [Glaciihabitans sp. INWT7]
MVLRLDPRLPLIWRTPQSLQLGLDHPRVVLEAVSSADERVIAALVTGVSPTGARMIGRSAGLDDPAFDSLMRRLAPALEHPAPRAGPASAVVSGDGETSRRIRTVLEASGMALIPDEPDAEPEIAVIVAHFVIEPEDHGRWLRRDIPHLAVVIGDETVRIGPIIRPGAGPCLHCLERHHTDADPAWPAMASQLWHRRSGLDSSLVAREVATTVARLVLAQRVVHRIEPLTSIEIDAATGDRMLWEWHSHPDCGCASLTA